MGSLPHSLAAPQVCNGNVFPDVDGLTDVLASIMNVCLLLSLLLSPAAFCRETEGGRHVERQASKGVHLTTLFADHGMHSSKPNHTAVNQCGGLSMEWFKVNKHLLSLTETASGYVHLGRAPEALSYVHSCLLLYSNDWMLSPPATELKCRSGISICCPAAAIVCIVMIGRAQLI